MHLLTDPSFPEYWYIHAPRSTPVFPFILKRGLSARYSLLRPIIVYLTTVFFLAHCSPPVFDIDEATGALNSPTEIAFLDLDSKPYGIAVNSNFDLSQNNGSLSIIDLKRLELVIRPDKVLKIQSLASKLVVDQGRSTMYLSQKTDDRIDIYRYDQDKELPIGITMTDSIEMSSNPYDLILIDDRQQLLVTNILSGIFSIVELGRPDRPITDITLDSNEPRSFRLGRGIGACVIALTPDKHFALIGSTNANIVFVVDLHAKRMEGYVHLEASLGGLSAGIRGIGISSKRNRAYVASVSQTKIIVLDLARISDNGINEEVIDAIVDEIPIVGRDPSTVTLSPEDERYLYFLNFEGASVGIVDLTLNRQIDTIDTGNGPIDIGFDKGTKQGLIVNFLSDSITVIDYETNTFAKTIVNPR